VLGQRSAADRKLNDAFLRAGGLHFLAVSGFNVAVLATAAWWLMRRALGCTARAAALLTVVLTLLFTLVTEPNAPILRGALGVMLAALARATRRPLCAINWLALAAACILIWNPNELFHAGFQLTFVQVLVLITVVPRAYRAVFARSADDQPPSEARTLPQLIMRGAGRAIAGLTLVCLCTWASALPLVLLHFGRLAPWGWLGTIPLTPLVTVITVLSLVTLGTNAVLPPVGALLGVVLRWLTDGLLWTVGLFEHVPGAVVECQPPPAWLVLLTYGVLLIFIADQPKTADETSAPAARNRRRSLVRLGTLVKANILALTALAWIVWVVFPAQTRGAGYALHVLSVGNGSAAVLTTPTGPAAVLDVGTDTNSDAGETAVRALRALRVSRVELAMVSHANFDHYSGLPTLMRGLAIDSWLVSPYFPPSPGVDKSMDRLFELLPRGAPRPSPVAAGAQLPLGGATLEVLWPPETLDEGWGANDRSLVVRLTAAGRTILLTGDIEKGALRALLDAERAGQLDLKADVLVAPHHGSVLKDVTADFYAAVSPGIVVVSSRTPRPKLERLVSDVLGPAGRVVLTGEAGDVLVRISPVGELTLETPYAHSD
jgi:competence protein ComEC